MDVKITGLNDLKGIVIFRIENTEIFLYEY
jgi:hypothetical protein